MYNAIICRYHEIAIKGNNRNMFEKQMVSNLRFLLRDIDNLKIAKIRGRIWVQHRESVEFTEQELEIIKAQLPKAFGLETFSPVIMCRPDIDELKQVVINSCKTIFDRAFAENKIVTFRVRARRSDKQFSLNSKGIEIALAETPGAYYQEDQLRVNLKSADVTIGCEVRNEFAFIFYETLKGPGGLPVGSNSPVLALLSGGIDSPVACCMAMKRGSRVDYLTFHSAPYTPQETIDKVKRVTDIINEFQKNGVLHICNLAPIQKEIRDKCHPEIRTVLYRRMMFRIAEAVARKNHRYALLTGEALGQVASQTVINMSTINAATDMLVLRPLVGMDKNEAITLARKLGTFDTCAEQVPDSCTVFAPPSPATRASLEHALAEEEKLGDYQLILEQIIADIVEYYSQD
ncbi:MAG: tRNA 4-thiouridine(8) synthase ThiI [Victivallaceae bacterium]|nr:tRNA 4-thiouridine(8) synthase ThiI [Victivallaceae bacterium]